MPDDAPQYTNFQYAIPVDPPYPPEEINPTGYYRTSSHPHGRHDKKVVLSFGGGLCLLLLGHNKYVGFSKDSRLPAEFDITRTAEAGAPAVVEVIVPRYCDGSYLEDQTCGTFRHIQGCSHAAALEVSIGDLNWESTLNYSTMISSLAVGTQLDRHRPGCDAAQPGNTHGTLQARGGLLLHSCSRRGQKASFMQRACWCVRCGRPAPFRIRRLESRRRPCCRAGLCPSAQRVRQRHERRQSLLLSAYLPPRNPARASVLATARQGVVVPTTASMSSERMPQMRLTRRRQQLSLSDGVATATVGWARQHLHRRAQHPTWARNTLYRAGAGAGAGAEAGLLLAPTGGNRPVIRDARALFRRRHQLERGEALFVHARGVPDHRAQRAGGEAESCRVGFRTVTSPAAYCA